MGNTKNALTGMVIAMAIVAFGGFFLLSGLLRSYHPAEVPDIVYNMPRPKNVLYNFLFGLEGREIVRTIVDPFKDKTKKDNAGATTKTAKNGPTKPAAKATPAAAAKTAATAARRPEVKINVVGSDPTKPLTDSSAPTKNPSVGGYAGVAPAVTDPNANATNTQNDPNKMSPAQWRALLQGQPTADNVAKLVAAFNSGDVDAGTLYLIMSDLFQSSNKDTQALGLVIADNVPSLRSFTTVVNDYDKMDKSVQAKADTYFLSYGKASRLTILTYALQSSESQVVLKAEQVFINSIEKGTAGGGARPTRGTNLTTAAVNYSKFIPLFQQLEKSSDSSIASNAQTALSQIQSYANL